MNNNNEFMICSKDIYPESIPLTTGCIENDKDGVLRKLKHIFPNTYQRIKSICSPAKVGTGCYRF